MKLLFKIILFTIVIILFTISITLFVKERKLKFNTSNSECPNCDDCINQQLTPVKHNFIVTYLGKGDPNRGYVYANITWYSEYVQDFKSPTPIEQNYPHTFYYTFPCQPLTFANLRSCYKVDVSMSEFSTKKTIYVPNYVKNLNIIISENNDNITFKYLDNISDGMCKYKWNGSEWVVDK